MYEELIKALREWKADYYLLPEHEQTLKDAADAIEELQKEVQSFKEAWDKEHESNLRLLKDVPRWIPVTEQMPEERVFVLCKCRANIYKVLRRQGVDWYEDFHHVFASGFVTHWMPLPQPPKEETE